jgi:hypothetical protein
MSQIQSIQVTLDDGGTITLTPRYNSQGHFDSEFLFNGPDDIQMILAIDHEKRRAEFRIEGSIATDRITMQS